MDSDDYNTGASEVRDLEELSENHVKALRESTTCESLTTLGPNHIDSSMDTIDDTTRPEKRNVTEILETLVKNKQAHFKSQQRGDPDLSVDEKKSIAENLFEKSPSGFLSRFGHLLSKKHLEYFHSFKYTNDQERDEVLYQLSYLGACSSKSAKTKLKNRRYDALQKMILSGSYFSMEEMQARNPLLYEQLIGRYQTDEEKQTQADDLPTNAEFQWMQHFEKQVEKERMEKLKEQQKLDEAGDEDDSSDETDKLVSKKESVSQSSNLWGEYRGKFETDKSKKKGKVPRMKDKARNFQNASEEEKAFYLQEFQTAMYHSFLSGNDKDFDYSSVDNNSEYDCVDMRERDEQDQYFDDESPDCASQAEMDISEGSQDDLAQFCEVPSINSDSASVIMDEDANGIGDVRDRLTEDDVQNLKTFASSWANNHTHSKNESAAPERTFNQSGVMDFLEKCTPSTHKVPVKKNHKIKISLKTKEM